MKNVACNIHDIYEALVTPLSHSIHPPPLIPARIDKSTKLSILALTSCDTCAIYIKHKHRFSALQNIQFRLFPLKLGKVNSIRPQLVSVAPSSLAALILNVSEMPLKKRASNPGIDKCHRHLSRSLSIV